jgi:N-acetylmuramoyl-L-alanine amidase
VLAIYGANTCAGWLLACLVGRRPGNGFGGLRQPHYGAIVRKCRRAAVFGAAWPYRSGCTVIRSFGGKRIMTIYKKLTVTNGLVNGFIHHPGFHGGALPTSAVLGLLSHTMVGSLPGNDALFTPGGNGNSAHFGTAQDGTVIQWVPLGVVAFHAIDANDSFYAVENADGGDPNNPYTDAQISRIAQILELTSRAKFGRFKMQVTNSPSKEGLGTHARAAPHLAAIPAPMRTGTRITLARGPAPKSCAARISSGTRGGIRPLSLRRPAAQAASTAVSIRGLTCSGTW